nr:class I SAM-dependent methyltransferase [Methanothrix sp.]
MNNAYVHGYAPRESARLQDQASTLVGLLHWDTCFAPGSLILEAGCGVGAQTVPLAKNSPQAMVIALDLSSASARKASRRAAEEGLDNVRVLQADIFHLPFREELFDHLFICFVLEHLPRPVEALRILMQFIRPGGSITVIEGDHGSAYFHPDS